MNDYRYEIKVMVLAKQLGRVIPSSNHKSSRILQVELFASYSAQVTTSHRRRSKAYLIRLKFTIVKLRPVKNDNADPWKVNRIMSINSDQWLIQINIAYIFLQMCGYMTTYPSSRAATQHQFWCGSGDRPLRPNRKSIIIFFWGGGSCGNKINHA